MGIAECSSCAWVTMPFEYDDEPLCRLMVFGDIVTKMRICSRAFLHGRNRLRVCVVQRQIFSVAEVPWKDQALKTVDKAIMSILQSQCNHLRPSSRLSGMSVQSSTSIW